MKASAGVKLSSRIKVTILDRPSFIPGIGTGFGIALSSIKMVSATTVKTDRVVSLFRFMSKLLFDGLPIDNLIADNIRLRLIICFQLYHKPVRQTDDGQQGGIDKARGDAKLIRAIRVDDTDSVGVYLDGVAAAVRRRYGKGVRCRDCVQIYGFNKLSVLIDVRRQSVCRFFKAKIKRQAGKQAKCQNECRQKQRPSVKNRQRVVFFFFYFI